MISRCWTKRATITLIDFGEAQLLVFDIDLHASNVGGHVRRHQGRIIRRARRPGPSTKSSGKGKLTNADGKAGEKNCWGLPRPGATIRGRWTTRPSAWRSSTTRRIRSAYWHSRGYGLMAANPFGRDKSGFPATKGNTDLVKLAKGEHLKLRYGVLLHNGDVKDGKVAEYYKKFVDWKE